MRRTLTGTCLFVLGMLACSPVDTGPAPASASGGGPVWTGGGGGTPDGGGGPGGSDAGGAGGAGAGGGAVDGGRGGIPGCEGVVPTDNPKGFSVVVPHAAGEVCWYFTTDGAGTVAAEAHSGPPPFTAAWNLWTSDGSPAGTCTATPEFQGQETGFESVVRSADGVSLVRFSGGGAEQKRTVLGGAGCRGETFHSAVGGSFALAGCEGGALVGTLFDSAGSAGAQKAVAPTLVNHVGLVDAKGNALVVAWPGSALGSSASYVARWFDGRLSPLTEWFDLPGSGSDPLVRPLIGGGAALRLGGTWIASIPSGSAAMTTAPEFLAVNPIHNFHIVRRGRAYAVFANYGAADSRSRVQLFSADGRLCGEGAFPAEGLSLGIEGTVIGSGGPGGCDMTWWSGVLR